MPFVAIPFTTKVEIVAHHTMTLIPIVNILHISSPNAATVAEVTDWATIIANYYAANINNMSNEYMADYVRVTDLSVAGGNQFTVPFAGGTVGTAGAGDPANTCALVKFTTALRSRSGRGRYFWGPVPHANVDVNGAISAAMQTALNTFFNGLATALLAAVVPANLVVASKAIPGSNDITSLSTEALAASQRRRIGR